MTDTTIDEDRVEELMGQMVGHMTGAALCFGILLGDNLGLYRELAGGALSAEQTAKNAGCNERLVQEWLNGQVAAGLVSHDPDAGTYTLSPEAAMVLADDTSPVFVARAMNAFASIFIDNEAVADAFRGDGSMSWSDHHPCLFFGTEWFFRTGYRASLASEWIPALEGVEEKLQAGASVADVGCGHGASIVAMAEAYPKATFTGVDFHKASLDTAKARTDEAGVGDRASFQHADARTYDGNYDLICFFDCLHDMGDPVGAARHAREHLNDGGTVLLVEPFALDDQGANIAENPMAAMMYTASSSLCVPNSLSQDVGLGLGAQAGEARLRDVFEEAGFSHFRRAAETPLNLILEARP